MTFSADGFWQLFALPLISGGQVHVGSPLDADSVSRLWATVDQQSQGADRVQRARQQVAAQMWLYPVEATLDREACSLLAGLHNILFLSHPRARRWRAESRALEKMVGFTGRCLTQQPPASETELVERHSLLGNVSRLMRTDVDVYYWAGRRRFQGMQPPSRLLRWQRVRRVREEHRQVGWLSTALSPVQHSLLRLLLRQSPLTDLLDPLRPVPPFQWLELGPYLRLPNVCRLSAHHYLQLGLPVVGPTLAGAFWGLVDAPAAKSRRRLALQLVAGLVVYLFVSTALSQSAFPLDLGSPATETPPKAEAPTADDLASVLVAAAGCGLVPDKGVLALPDVDQRLRQWLDRASGRLGRSQAVDFTGRLKKALAD